MGQITFEKIKQETNGEIIGNIEIVRIPLNLYRALNVTSRKWLTQQGDDHPFTSSPVFLVGDSALGSPYFQSISLGLESAIHLAGLMGQRNLSLTDIFDRFELYMYKQWLRVYMRSKMIKHNKDLFENIDDPLRLLDLLHIYQCAFVLGGFLPTFLDLIDLVSSIADINGMESVPQPLTQNIVSWLFK